MENSLYKTYKQNLFLKNVGKKLYKCVQCSQAFKRNSQLDAHIRIHTGFWIVNIILLKDNDGKLNGK